jgi:hypothetical protein
MENAMPLSDGLPRPDLAADREALSLAWPEIVKRLTEMSEGNSRRTLRA